MLKNRAYVGDLVQGVYEGRKIRDDRRVTDPEKWIVTENHHEPIIDRETFDKVQARFRKTNNQLDGCVKRIEDFYLEEIVLFQIQQHIMELGESDKLLQAEKDAAAVDDLKKKCERAEKAMERAKAKRMAAFEAYVLGKKESYDASADEMEKLRKKREELMEQLSQAEDKARELSRIKVHESFAVTRLTPELLDEYVESIEVHSGDEVRISWK